MNDADKEFVGMIKKITEIEGQLNLTQKTTANDIAVMKETLTSMKFNLDNRDKVILDKIDNVFTIKGQEHQIKIMETNQSHNLEIDNKINIFKEGLNDVKTEITIAKRLARMIGMLATGTGAVLGSIIGWFFK